jgi:hypothetical protein
VVAWRSLKWRGVGLAAVAVALCPLVPTFHYPDWQPSVPAFFTSSAVDAIPSGATVLVVPIPRGGVGDVGPMVWQAESGLRFALIGGVVFVPTSIGGRPGDSLGGGETSLTAPLDRLAKGATVPDLRPTAAGVARDRQILRAWGVRAVVLGPMKQEGAALALLEAVMGRAPRAVGGIFLWLGAAGGAS